MKRILFLTVFLSLGPIVGLKGAFASLGRVAAQVTARTARSMAALRYRAPEFWKQAWNQGSGFLFKNSHIPAAFIANSEHQRPFLPRALRSSGMAPAASGSIFTQQAEQLFNFFAQQPPILHPIQPIQDIMPVTEAISEAFAPEVPVPLVGQGDDNANEEDGVEDNTFVPEISRSESTDNVSAPSAAPRRDIIQESQNISEPQVPAQMLASAADAPVMPAVSLPAAAVAAQIASKPAVGIEQPDIPQSAAPELAHADMPAQDTSSDLHPDSINHDAPSAEQVPTSEQVPAPASDQVPAQPVPTGEKSTPIQPVVSPEVPGNKVPEQPQRDRSPAKRMLPMHNKFVEPEEQEQPIHPPHTPQIGGTSRAASPRAHGGASPGGHRQDEPAHAFSAGSTPASPSHSGSSDTWTPHYSEPRYTAALSQAHEDKREIAKRSPLKQELVGSNLYPFPLAQRQHVVMQMPYDPDFVIESAPTVQPIQYHSIQQEKSRMTSAHNTHAPAHASWKSSYSWLWYTLGFLSCLFGVLDIIKLIKLLFARRKFFSA